ncbi:MFS transporter [Candidatus Thioglobus sp. NP1]|uniref:MFS transporter n=1 Tax=Candidatus Thioglobus sp. NP1 TaxID=2508687 RepID=UPI000DED80ED|nr:MFS transporter [Candidatus Thioglobus sp. NP1]AXE61500.1 MFS transporter [Candidatus Thioglobus sp. NP1]
MFNLPKNVWILTACQSLFMSLSVFMVFVAGIIGSGLSPIKSLSTLPVATIVVGTAVSVIPVIKLMSIFGRKKVFLSVCIYTILIIGLSILSIIYELFFLFSFSSLCLGASVATMMQFRFAAIESVDPEKRPLATAVVILGGLISAFIGTEIATLGKNYFETDFVGSFTILAFLFVIAFILMSFFKPAAKFKEQTSQSKRSLFDIIKQGSFLVAVSAATTGYVVMSFIMTATPVSMHVMDGFSLHQTKVVLQSHVIAMFLPSLFTAFLLKYIGLTRMMLLGVVLFFTSIFIAFSSHALSYYWWSLVLLGLGWNFLFIGGTNLLPKSYNENEKFQVQSINDFLIFGLQALAALSAGWFVFNFGWEVVLISTIPLLFFQLFILIWWLKKGN